MRLRSAFVVLLGAGLVAAQDFPPMNPRGKGDSQSVNNDGTRPPQDTVEPGPIFPPKLAEQEQSHRGEDTKTTSTKKLRGDSPTTNAGADNEGDGAGLVNGGVISPAASATPAAPDSAQIDPNNAPHEMPSSAARDREQRPTESPISNGAAEPTGGLETKPPTASGSADKLSGSPDAGANQNQDGTSAGGADAANAAAPKKKSNTGLIVGVVVGVVGGLILIIGALIFFLRRRKRHADVEGEPRQSLVVDKGKARALPDSGTGYETLSAQPSYYGEYDSSGSSLPNTQMQQMGHMSSGAGVGAGTGRGGRGGRDSVASTETAQRLQDSIANDAFERAKATANANAAANAQVSRGAPVRRHAEDATDQAPPYWLTAGEEFGDDKARTG